MRHAQPTRPLYLFWILLIAALTLVSATHAVAQETDGRFVDKVYRDADGEHKYAVFVPAGYTADADKTWPTILFLHGAGERGADGRAQTRVGLGPIVKARSDTFPFLVVFPQAERTDGQILSTWNADEPDGKRALAILDEVEKEYRVDREREVLTGWSMGGYGVWSLAAAAPDRWHALVSLSGGTNQSDADLAKLKDVPAWIVHGGRDKVVRPEESRKLFQSLKNAGARVQLTVLPDADHNVWMDAYDSDQLIRWMRDPKVAAGREVTLQTPSGERVVSSPDENEPFVPALELPNAVSLRLGNRMLETLAVSVPKMVPEDLLRGRVEDIYDTTYSNNRAFNVVLSGISYSGELARTRIKAYRKDRLNIQLGLQNMQLYIGGAYVTGRDHSATTGAMSVVIGHRRPVWLSIDVTPYVADRKLKLKLVATRFDIPDDNWYVTAPGAISTRGFGMTREKVSSGLVNGLYGSKQRIENEVRAMVPDMIPEIEKELDVSQANRIVSGFWPLPVYRPRLRMWPQEVATDKNGVSLVLGVTAAAVDSRKAPSSPETMAPLGRSIEDTPKTDKLRVGVAAGILGPLTDLLIDADVARVDVADVPEEKFARLGEREFLETVIPDLKRLAGTHDVTTEIVMTSPVTIDDPSDSEGTPRFALDIASLRFVTLARPLGSTEWTPYVEFEAAVSQQAEVRLTRPTRTTRALRLETLGAPDINLTGRFTEGTEPDSTEMHLDRFQAALTEAWTAWTQSGAATEFPVEDLDFGLSAMRLESVGWDAPTLFAEFGIPGVKLINSSDQPLVYETKGPYSGWGGPYTLEPGKTHNFEIAYPLTYRSRSSGSLVVYTLPPGSHSEFRAPRGGGPPRLFQAREVIPAPAPEKTDEADEQAAESEETPD